MAATKPIVSFTFDDFPRTAFGTGGAILERHGVAGTYFVSLGLMGQNGPSGELFHADDLTQLLGSRQELGCHTYHHHPAWETASSKYLSSVIRNATVLATYDSAEVLATHSYPISYPRPETKRRLAPRFRACRGGGQTFNFGTIDLNYLNSFFLEQSRDDFGAIERIIAANAEAGGWLIFSTHDVCESPSRYGVKSEFFEDVARCSIRSGAAILPMSQALSAIGAP